MRVPGLEGVHDYYGKYLISTTFLTYAVSEDDYLDVTMTLEFVAGQNQVVVVVDTLSDDAVEDVETFNALLSGPSEGVMLGVDSATVEITDTTGKE